LPIANYPLNEPIKMKRTILYIIVSLSIVANAQNVKPGMNAPPITVYKWLKGKPVKEFQRDKIYVIEFGATWCGPCSAAIPELSALAGKYTDKVIVISFFVMEQMSHGQNPYGSNVERFVKKRWDQMNYTVALDHREGTMQHAWLKNAGQTGIPFTVVIDREGKVAWTGNNIKQLDEVIHTLINNH